MIRKATRADIDRIVEMAGEFYADTNYAAIVPMAKESAAGLAILMMDTGVMLVAESQDGDVVGMVGLHVDQFTFNVSKRMATEIIWWVDYAHQNTGVGRALLSEVEPACMERGVDMIRMLRLATSPPSADALYKKMGYIHSETTYTKVIGE